MVAGLIVTRLLRWTLLVVVGGFTLRCRFVGWLFCLVVTVDFTTRYGLLLHIAVTVVTVVGLDWIYVWTLLNSRIYGCQFDHVTALLIWCCYVYGRYPLLRCCCYGCPLLCLR